MFGVTSTRNLDFYDGLYIGKVTPIESLSKRGQSAAQRRWCRILRLNTLVFKCAIVSFKSCSVHLNIKEFYPDACTLPSSLKMQRRPGIYQGTKHLLPDVGLRIIIYCFM